MGQVKGQCLTKLVITPVKSLMFGGGGGGGGGASENLMKVQTGVWATGGMKILGGCV